MIFMKVRIQILGQCDGRSTEHDNSFVQEFVPGAVLHDGSYLGGSLVTTQVGASVPGTASRINLFDASIWRLTVANEIQT